MAGIRRPQHPTETKTASQPFSNPIFPVPRLGLISDTHGFLDPQVPARFAGVQHILHAGDIGPSQLILRLETIAPVTAVTGNTDHGLPYRETEVVTLFGRKLLVHHIVDPHRPSDLLQARLAREQPDVVVFGHTHETHCERIGTTLFVNPGSAGRARFGKPRTLAFLHWSDDDPELRVDFGELRD